ncbi:MAG: porin family protein [Deltaproteobacteria bacterium]|nr:porin family protein [Deltaproteobacteria bacterium]
MKRIENWLLAAAGSTAALVLLAAGPSTAQSDFFNERQISGYDYTGPYGQFGVSIGKINIDRSDLENDVAGGFTIGGGYRFLPWLAADGNFTYLAGDVEIDGFGGDFDAEAWGFTFGPKFYPLGLAKVQGIPHFFQPYATIGIGGGEAEIDDTSVEEDYFLARFILGFDLWMTNHFGLFVEGGGFATSEDDIEGAGLFTLGGQYRF